MARWRRERLFALFGAIFIVNAIIVLILYPRPDTPLVRFRNRCPHTNNLLPTTIQPPNERPKTLVIFIYAETSPLKADNLRFFIEYGLCEHCDNVDYAFILNGPSTVPIPEHKNVVIMHRPNECGDFGAWGEFFTKMGSSYKKYKRIMFINDTVRGPFINPHFLLFSQDFHFTDIFATYLSNETRMVGSYINCGGLIVGEGFAHVQSMSFMVDDVALELILPLFKCYDNRTETVKNGEIGMSRLLISKNINIASLLYAYRGVDFRCNDELRHNCNEQKDPAFDEWYFGLSANPMEVVFFKNNRQNSKLEQLNYQNWVMKTKDFT